MGWKVAILFFGVSLAIGLSASTPDERSRKELVDAMHNYYVSQFENLTMTKEGVFGTGRVEQSKITNHVREGGDPGYARRDWMNSVTIYGNHGRPLKPGQVTQRYSRFTNGSPGSNEFTASDARLIGKAHKEIVAEATKAYSSGRVGNLTKKAGSTFLEARPIRLTKKECFPCHEGMKKNDPVAIMVYTMTPVVIKH